MTGIPTYDDDARRAAHAAVDALFDHVQHVAARPVVEWRDAADLRELVRLGEPKSLDDSIALLTRYAIQLHHPSYMGHQVCPPFPTAAIGDFVISALNQSTAVWEMSPLATVIEQEVVRWLADLAGYPADALGTAVSGGSAANLTGLLAARAKWNDDAANRTRRPVILCSSDAHYSIARAAGIMAIPPDDVLKIETDDEHRLDAAAVEDAIRSLDPSRGVLAVVATAGSTATGAFDRLDAIADVAQRHGAWLHVDAAHGASVLFSDRLAPLVRGLSRADSFAWDPHKMLWMPLSLGIILVRDAQWLRRAFSADAPYLFHAERAMLNIGEVTIQCSKRADAVKLWLTLNALGRAPFAAALEKVADLTRYTYEQVAASGDFEPMHAPDFNIFCWRHRSDDETNLAIRERLIRSGDAWITSTMLKGRRVLRVTMINPHTEREQVDAMLRACRELA